MDLENQKDNLNSKGWLCSVRKEKHYDIYDFYTFWWQKYKFIHDNMISKWFRFLSQWIIEDSLVSIKIREQTWIDYQIRVSFYKPIDNYEEKRKCEIQNILNWRKSSLLFNQL